MSEKKEWADERVRWFQAAIAAAPANYAAHINLGNALKDKDRVDEAAACFRKAIELDSEQLAAHTGLGIALAAKGQLNDAISCFRKAVEIDPKFAAAYMNLGSSLRKNGDVDGAIDCYRKAIELEPGDHSAYVELGAVYCDIKRDYDGAINFLRKAIELNSMSTIAHYNLGTALDRKGRLDEAITSYRKATELDTKLDPIFAAVYNSLGAALLRKGQTDEAIASFRKATEHDSKFTMAYNGLAVALISKGGQTDEAIASFRKATEIDPQQAGNHANLGSALMMKGDLDGGIASFRKAIEIDPSFTSARNGLARAERMAAAQEKLPALLKGDYKPTSNTERLVLADLCHIKNLHRTAAGLYADAFADTPRVADDLQAALRHKAACSAALAAAGQGNDSAQLDDGAKAKLCNQALVWLKADLIVIGKLLDSGPPQARPFIVQTLSGWQKKAALASLRDEDALVKLPADEQKAWTQLWADVAALLKKAEAPAKKEEKK